MISRFPNRSSPRKRGPSPSRSIQLALGPASAGTNGGELRRFEGWERMSGIPITFACGLYDRMLALHTGDVKPHGIDLNFLAIDHPREIFDRMLINLEFDACEMS